MIRAHFKEGLLGEGRVHHFEIPSAAGLTARKVMDIARSVPALSKRDLGVAVNGKRLSGREIDLQLPDGAEVLVAAPQHGAELGVLLVQALISAVIGVAINYLVSLLLPKPKPPGLPQDRGDDSSATYAWDGIQTSYGQGQPIGFGYGRHTLGGQVISEDVQVDGAVEYLKILLALCEGPIWRIGDVLAAERDVLPLLPPPNHILVNDGVFQNGQFAMRPGSLNQTPIQIGGFSRPVTTFTVGVPLPNEQSSGTFLMTGTEVVGSIKVVITFPSGLFRVDLQGTKVPVTWPWRIEWRFLDDTFWRLLGESPRTTHPLYGTQHSEYILYTAGSLSFTFQLPPDTHLPIEIRFRREYRNVLFPLVGQVIDDSTWRQLMQFAPQEFSYPGVALVALGVPANALAFGSRPQIRVRADLDLVRVWDASLGWSDPCWDVPAAPFNWMTHQPGRNPAWQAVRFCLDEEKGLGRWFKEADIDLDAARRWSILCDVDPNPGDPWGEPSFTCDVFFDAPRPAWERLLAICATARCTPILLGRRISFVYQYRDAHSDSLVSVPAKAPVQLFTSTNIQDLRINWLPKRGRSTVIQYQFLNESKDHAQDVLTVEDPEGNANDTNNPLADSWQPEVTQVYGVTRESQLLREGVFTHRLQREVSHEILFLTGPWALGAQVGNLIWVENEVLRPFAGDVPMSCAIEQDQVAHNKMIVGHVITGTGLRVVFRDLDGAPKQVDIVSLLALAGGRTELTLATSESFIAGAPAVVGKVAKLTKPYLIVGIGLTQTVHREVRCIEWKPSIFDPIGPDFFSEPPAEPEEPEPEVPDDVNVGIEAKPGGGHVLSWSHGGASQGRRARVWVQRLDLDAWILLGESITSQLETGALSALATYRVAVCLEQGGGVFAVPEAAAAVDLVAPEFPRLTLPPIRRLTIEPQAGGFLFRWPAQGQWDLHYYELRAGSSWITAKPIYRGQLEEVFVAEPPRATTFHVAARSISGLYGAPASATVIASWAPEGKAAYAERDELDTTPGGTLDAVSYDAGPKILRFTAATDVAGSYTAPEIDAGYVAPWHWQVDQDYTLVDDGTCGEEAGTCGDGEALWSTCACRPPSPARPGLAVDDGLVGDDLGLCGDDSPFETVSGGLGEVGALASVALESRYHDGAAWSEWTAHVDGLVVSQKIQTRTRLERATPRVTVEVTTLKTSGYL